MNTFMVTLFPGKAVSQSFIVENVRNEADAINEAFRRAALNDENQDEYVRVNCTQIPINLRTMKIPKDLEDKSKAATPGRWWIREFPNNPERFFIAHETYPGHPYHNVASSGDIMSDEDYPTKRADAELICAVVNFLRGIE